MNICYISKFVSTEMFPTFPMFPLEEFRPSIMLRQPEKEFREKVEKYARKHPEEKVEAAAIDALLNK